ncbi:hypothetical protein QQ045_009812 [Rhodiola kirilowii]
MESEVKILSNRIKGELAVTVRKDVREKAEESFRWAVMVKLCNGNPFNAPAMLDALKMAWNIKEELGYQEMLHNRMVIKLRSEEEQRRILEGGPGPLWVGRSLWRNGVLVQYRWITIPMLSRCGFKSITFM